MDKKDLEYFKGKLLEEKERVIEELKSVGRINPDNPEDWEPTKSDFNIPESDKNDVADEIEEYEERSAILKELEIAYNDINRALEKIKEGNYGVCEVSGDDIPRARLEANPAARTTVEHAHEL